MFFYFHFNTSFVINVTSFQPFSLISILLLRLALNLTSHPIDYVYQMETPGMGDPSQNTDENTDANTISNSYTIYKYSHPIYHVYQMWTPGMGDPLQNTAENTDAKTVPNNNTIYKYSHPIGYIYQMWTQGMGATHHKIQLTIQMIYS